MNDTLRLLDRNLAAFKRGAERRARLNDPFALGLLNILKNHKKGLSFEEILSVIPLAPASQKANGSIETPRNPLEGYYLDVLTDYTEARIVRVDENGKYHPTETTNAFIDTLCLRESDFNQKYPIMPPVVM